MADPTDDDDTYRPINRRTRLKIIGLTVVTVTILWLLLFFQPGGHVRVFPETQRPACKPGQTTDCVGGKANVTLISASRPAAAASTGR